MRSRNWEGPAFLLAAFFLAGTSVVAVRFIEGYLGAFTITAISLLLAAVFLLPLCLRSLLVFIQRLSPKILLLVVLQALFGIFLFRLCLFQGLMLTSTAEAGVMTGASPAITALLGILLLKERPNRAMVAGILSTVAGVLLIQGLGAGGLSLSLGHLAGNLLVLCAAACESIFNILVKMIHQSKKDEAIHPMAHTTAVVLCALVLCILPAMLERPFGQFAALGSVQWLALIWYGVFVTAFAFVFMFAGAKRSGAFAVAACSGMMPFAAMLLSLLLLHEAVAWQQWLGGVFVALGMVVIGSGKSAIAQNT